jgi:hypothetical protein
MSKERELLKRWVEGGVLPVYKQILKETEELLNQSEPSEIAFKIANEIADQFQKGFCDYRMVEHFAEAVDKHLPKRKPLSESEISAIWDDSYNTDVAITRAIEKAHGIGE